MTAPILAPDHSLITRRSILVGLAANLLCAPAIVRAANLMPVRLGPLLINAAVLGFILPIGAIVLFGRRVIKIRRRGRNGPRPVPDEDAGRTISAIEKLEVAAALECSWLPLPQ